MSTPSFRFKRFEVFHNECAMKVGTDAVLLGAWCVDGVWNIGRCAEGVRILDIGTGSGVIALMIAQQLEGSDFHIDAIDIDEGAVRQATKNFGLSPWAEHLSVHHTSLQGFTQSKMVSLLGETHGRGFYSLIVSNPPYFQNSLKNPDKGRELARHTDSLSYEELIRCSASLLAENGTLALILPSESEETIIALAKQHGLCPITITDVFPKPDKPSKRILIAFVARSEIGSEAISSRRRLVLQDGDNPRSEQYAELTKDYYL